MAPTSSLAAVIALPSATDVVEVAPPWPGPGSLAVCVVPRGAPDLASLYDAFDAVVVVRDAATAQQVLARLQSDRPTPAAPPPPVAATGLRLDPAGGQLGWNGRPLPLTPREHAVLACLAGRPRRTWTFRQLYEAGWGGRYLGDPAAVYSTVKRLRGKLRAAGARTEIESVRGVGLRLRDG